MCRYRSTGLWYDKTAEFDRFALLTAKLETVYPNLEDSFSSLALKKGYLNTEGGRQCLFMRPDIPSYDPLHQCSTTFTRETVAYAVCERGAKSVKYKVTALGNAVLAPDYTLAQLGPNFLQCPVGHVTHKFLACDVKASCWSHEHKGCSAPLTPIPPHFMCRNEDEEVPYTLLCDHRADCRDRSDENFCTFQACSFGHFSCGDGQCLEHSQLCDGWQDCISGLDESDCKANKVNHSQLLPYIPPPALIVLDAYGKFGHKNLANKASTKCPDTHFQCPRNGYCLPVFLRCNGINDCPFHDDEADCDRYTCPGFYHCWDSHVCLHPDNVCDGRSNCPQHDDELVCNAACPDHCVCYGHTFFCSQRFNSQMYPDLRYLDVHGTNTTPEDLKDNTFLMFLNLTQCGLFYFKNVDYTLPNLLILDLSFNHLPSVPVTFLTLLPELRELYLAGNPLSLLFGDIHDKVPKLVILDLSYVPIQLINTSSLNELFPSLHTLNLSHSRLQRVMNDGFQSLRQLRVVDLRGCPLPQFSNIMFQELEHLESVHASSFRLCCPVLLPEGFNVHQCQAPVDELSSCESLLGSIIYAVCVFLFALFAVVGNSTSFVYRSFFSKSKSKMGFAVLVTHLSISDLMMGVYLVIIGSADRVFHGDYLWHDHTWRHSAACSLAGFLSLLSSEVSALIMSLITLDRFLVLRFPFSRLHFGTKSAHAVSAIVWVLGLSIATVPLTKPHWQFYSVTGICIPLPITRIDFPGRLYSFSIVIVFNFILFLFVSLGQAVIYWSVRTNVMSVTNTTRKTQDLTIARRLLTVAMSDFLCWFPIGLLGLLASRGVAVSSEVNVAMAVLVLPLNSALNPFLYTVNIIMERRRVAREERLRVFITSQLASAKTAA